MRCFCVITTVRCNLTCSYCYNDTHSQSVAYVPRVGRPRVFTPELVERCCQDLMEAGVARLVLTGGEPFTSRTTLEWIRGARDIPIRVLTNGTLLTDSILEAIGAHPNLRLSISIGGASQRSHDEFRGKWALTKATMDRLKQAGVDFQLSFVATARSLEELPEVERLAESYGVRARIAALSTGDLSSETLHLSLRRVSRDEWQEHISRCAHPDLARDLMVIASYFTGRLVKSTCPMRTRTQVMDPDGNVFGCFFRQDLRYGNVFEESLVSILSRIDSKALLSASCMGEHCLTMQYQ